MYNEYFGLHDSPFSIAPNPRYLYMSERHREALAHLLYGIRSDGGFILITGEVGTGKTTVCRCLLEQIPDDIDTAFILNPKLTAHELLATICDELCVEYPEDGTIKDLVDTLGNFLLSSHNDGRHTVLVIDEAQNLSVEVLEQLRLLTNLETNQRKLLQVILLGQPELLDMLSQQELRQLSQRITARFHLDVLNREEVQEYIRHRLSVAGSQHQLITPAAMRRIFKLSGGTPRLINLLSDRALLGAWVEGRSKVTRRIVNKAAREVFGTSSQARHFWPVAGGVAAMMLIAVIAAFEYYPSLEAPALPVTDATRDVPARNPAETETTADDKSKALVTATVSGITDKSAKSGLQETTDLSQVKGFTRQDLAFADLFSLWGIPLTNGTEDPCIRATTHLRCLDRIGNLRDLEHLNRPALIRLSLDNTDYWFTLVQLQYNHAHIVAGDREFLITREQMLSNWDGHYTLLWHAPPNYTRPVKRGDQGAIVDSLVNQLDILEKREIANNTGYTFDAAVQQRVKRFQISAGLNPDGIAGAKTWIHLNTQRGEDVPLLKSYDQG